MASRACTQTPMLFRHFAAVTLLLLASTHLFAQAQRGVSVISPPSTAGTGRYYALIIGIDSYSPPFNPLKTAAGDARALSELLTENFGFTVQSLFDARATRSNILEALSGYGTLGENDNLLIYYAGHGYNDPKAQKLFWIPVDVNSFTSPNRIIVDEITTTIRDLPPRHILVISDSCYAADFTRSIDIKETGVTDAFIRRMLSMKSRTLMASGSDEPVSDGGGGGHSIFSAWLLRALASETDSAFTASDLFHSIQRPVAGGSRQTPQYLTIPTSGDEGGDFVFVRSGKAPVVVAAAQAPAAPPDSRGLSAPPPAQTAPAAPPPAEPTAVPAAPVSNAGGNLDPLLGQFDFGNAVITMASLTPGSLSMLAPGQPPLALVPAGDLRFDDRDVANCSWLFRRDPTGALNELVAYFPGGFSIGIRVSGEKIALGELKTFVGQYRFGGVTITIGLLPSGVLTYSIPGQPPINLRLARGRRFVLDGILSTSVEFVPTANGQVAGLTLHLATADAFVPRIN